MKAYLRVRSMLIMVLLVLVTIVSCLGFSACLYANSDKLTNENGFVVEGGRFEKGSILEASLIDGESKEYSQVLTAIEGERYDKTKPVYVFEISVKKDGVKVQPNGKVKVTVPISENVTDYDVLHVKDSGKLERLSVTYKNGKATFETGSFSKFAFVKRVSSGGENSGHSDSSGRNDSSSGNGGDSSSSAEETTKKYIIRPFADRIASTSYGRGGQVLNANEEYIEDKTLELAEGTEYTVVSKCANENYSFIGWYEATEREEATEDTFLSNNPTYTFTVTKDFTILALYAYKDDIVEFTLKAQEYGFSYRNGEPTVTRVSSKTDADKPNYDNVPVHVLFGDGRWRTYYQSAVEFDRYIDFDLGGLDYSKVGTYTITYTYKYNSNIKATLTVQVVDSAHTLTVTGDSNLYFYCNEFNSKNSYTEVLAEGRLVTLSALPESGYAFTGWYNGDTLISKDLVYCFEMPNHDVTLHGKYEKSSVSLRVSLGYYDEGELVDDFGNAYFWTSQTFSFKTGEKASFTVRENDSYEFLGWYDVTGDQSNLITTDKTVNLTITENKSIKTEFREKVKSIEIDSETLSNEGFVDGKVGFAIGDTAIDYQNFTVNAKGVAGSNMTLSASDYIIDDSSLNLNAVGVYTITYTYKFNANIKTKIRIVVIDPESKQFTFTKGYSYLDHEYNGKATFISLQDVKVNGVALYNFRSDSNIWKKISYKWIDKSTNKEVDTEGVDITINGKVIKNFGGKNEKITIGNEFCGPIQAGSYRFELMYDGEIVLTQDSTISTHVYKKITSKDEFKTNEGSTWINFELYYYTIIGYADGKYYAMQIPTIGYGNYEAEAREVSFDANGNAIIGEGNDFAFVNVRYYANDYSGCTEFLTGYYGSYIIRSSSNTVDGTLFGSPYIYRTGYTSVSGGRIYREYGDKAYYGMRTEFDENGAVTIYSRYYGETANNRLRLVKDGDKYVFTSVEADTDTRESFDVFIYQSLIENNAQESDK